jgi:hypothetical protein
MVIHSENPNHEHLRAENNSIKIFKAKMIGAKKSIV